MKIVPFETPNQLPAHLLSENAAEVNNDLTSHAGAGFPVISIKGKVFATVRDGERKIIPNPKDPESPAPHIDMVIVKANRDTSKVYYIKGYTEGAEATKPDCFSNDGKVPDPSSEHKQAATCASCKHNAWGSKVSTDGQGGKGKACQDTVRIAVSAPTLLNDPYLIRVPPASIKALAELGNMLAKRGVKYQGVITRIGFVQEASTPQLTFKPMGFIDADTFAQVQEVAASEVVQAILGTVSPAATEPNVAPTKEVTKEEVAKVIDKAAGKAEKPATKPLPPKAAPVPTEAEMEKASASAFAIDLEGLSFDD